jgi:3-deoxy-D-manno-octulosonate 8-phosphate phosphatase (KDO 8-P phosphatase)
MEDATRSRHQDQAHQGNVSVTNYSNPRVIQLLALDVDGVLTDGSIWIGQDGYDLKRFHVRDGLGLKIWMKLGFQVAIISGRHSNAVQRRMDELGVTQVFQGVKDKVACVNDILDRTGLTLAQIAYIGDDWPDAPVLKRVGYPIVVGDAEDAIRRLAVYVTARPGGQAAVREAIDHLLLGKGKTDAERAQAGLDGTEKTLGNIARRSAPGDEIFPTIR